jgi:Protein of unknown function (DUF1161)
MYSILKTRLMILPVFISLSLGQQIYAADVSSTSQVAAPTSARKSCEDLKSEIEAKIQAKGLKAFTLSIVPKDEVGDAKIVGSCESGSKKITYKKG